MAEKKVLSENDLEKVSGGSDIIKFNIDPEFQMCPMCNDGVLIVVKPNEEYQCDRCERIFEHFDGLDNDEWMVLD